MATTSLTATQREVLGQTLVAATTDTINFVGRWSRIRVINEDGAAEIRVTFDGTDPGSSSPAGDVKYLPAKVTSEDYNLPYDSTSANSQVKVKSSGTPKYSVIGL